MSPRQLVDHVARLLPASVSRNSEELDTLMEREREVLRMLAAGLSQRRITTGLTVSKATVKSHVSGLLKARLTHLGAGAVIYAYEMAIITPSESVMHHAPISSWFGVPSDGPVGSADPGRPVSAVKFGGIGAQRFTRVVVRCTRVEAFTNC